MTTISIITATYNAAATLRDCIDSVAMQNHGAQHIIVDGVSTDETPDIVAANKERVARFISEPDQGLYDAMNKGIAAATSDVVGILNADDFYPDADVLSRVAAAFEDDSVDACYGDLHYVDATDTDKVVRNWKSGVFSRSKFLWGWMPPHPTFFVRRRLYQDYGAFDLALGSAADYELMLRFLYRHDALARYIPVVQVKMRAGGVSNASLANRVAANRMDRKAWRVNGLRPYPWTTLVKPARKLLQWL